MKHIILFTLTTLISITINAQYKNIGLQYYSTGAGENLTGTLSVKKNKSELGFGLGFNINSIRQPDDEANIYYKRLYATRPIHFFNLNFFYQRDIFSALKKIKPFIVYDLQIKHSSTRSSMYIPFDYDSTLVVNEPEEGILYRKYIEYFGPFTWVENSIGIGVNINVTDKISMTQKIGGGIHFIFGDEPKLVKYRPYWEFMYFFNIGLTYKINKKAHNKG